MAGEETILTGKQKRYLRGRGSTIDPILLVGKGGIVPGIVQQADDALEARELIKVRILKNCLEDRDGVARELSKQTDAALVQVIGHTFLLYRPAVKNPQIQLPQ